MSEMISIATGFQYSVNIGYDLSSNDKLRNFIPTQSALRLLEEILLSTAVTSTERSRILIGAYGKGKSHIILTILSILLKKDLPLFEKLMPKVEENPRLSQLIQNYYDSNNKILPVVIAGSNTSLTQAFLLALQRTLSENDFLDVMPETNYKAAISVIERWKNDFPNTFEQLKAALDEPISELIAKLNSYNISAYETFERIYPSLTAGSIFNPFLGFDVVELYESVAEGLREKGYSGLYVVYDEFSKYLEASITEASVSDTKMLQDFAEKCNRSGTLQLHLMLICHKEVANYIDKLPKQKVDGWRGVSERFKHIHLNNNFSQTYEIIASVIQKCPESWAAFQNVHRNDFQNIHTRYRTHPLFAGNEEELRTAIYGCYPLHPVSTFILPRLSERVAQNERTLFTFLSSEGAMTLRAFLDKYNDDAVTFITPDAIYDYFEPLFKKEVYGGEIHDNYVLTSTIISRLPEDSLEVKLVKTISLIYTLQQFERLKPTKDEMVNIFSASYTAAEIIGAIDTLIEKEFVVYLKRSNNYLRLKQTSGIDIWQKINDLAEVNTSKISVKDILNTSNFDNYMYPSRYNDTREMTRFFSFVFIDESEVTPNTNWIIKSETSAADGIIFAVILHGEESISTLGDILLDTSRDCPRQIFILPKHFFEIDHIVREFQAVIALRNSAVNDPVLFNEYDVVYEDLRDVISTFIARYTQPEGYAATYIFNAEVHPIHRKAALTELLSDICDNVYSQTPVINNEAVNRNEITGIATNSRSKIVSALLRNQLETNLGLTGTGQEVSIMRSTLVRTGMWSEDGGTPHIILHPDNEYISNMVAAIEQFFQAAQNNGPLGFDVLYDVLTLPEHHIGLRRGLIPIYLAAVIHEYKQQLMISDRFGQVAITSDALLQINADPAAFTLSYIDWDPEKERYITQLAEMFSPFVVDAERGANAYDFIANAMRRWMMALPKFAKESTSIPTGGQIDDRYRAMMRLLRQSGNSYDLLFVKLPRAFHYREGIVAGLAENIEAAKGCYDGIMSKLKRVLIKKTKTIFLLPQNQHNKKLISMTAAVQDWCDTLDQTAFDHLFQDDTEKVLALFKSITNDEDAFIVRLAKAVTGLRTEDWNAQTVDVYVEKLAQHKQTAESYHKEHVLENTVTDSNYQIAFVNGDGGTTTRSFERVNISARGKLLYNQITKALEAMGQAISEQEKRQILVEILKELC